MSRNFALLSALALSLAIPSWAGKTYTREEAINIALEKSSDVKSAEEDLKSASSQVTAGYGNAYPTIDLSATVTRIFGLDDVEKSTDLTDAAAQMAAGTDENGNPMANAYDQQVIGEEIPSAKSGEQALGTVNDFATAFAGRPGNREQVVFAVHLFHVRAFLLHVVVAGAGHLVHAHAAVLLQRG